MESKRIAIVGAGITGLVSAWTLQKRGNEVVVFERKGEPGGSIKTVRNGGWQVEYGPNTLQLKSEKLLEFFRDIGLENDTIDADTDAANRYIVKQGSLIPVPTGISGLVGSPLFSTPAKLGLLREPFTGRGNEANESVSSFVRRRLGNEFLDYGVNPFIAGIYAGDPDQLSVRHTFPRLYHLEKTYRSLIAGAIIKRVQDSTSSSFKTRLVSFKNGLGQLPAAVASHIDQIHYNEDVSRLQHTSTGWEVISNGARHSSFDRVLLNIPLYRINEQFIDGGGRILEVMDKAGYPPLSVIQTGYKKNQVGHPLNGFGYLVPEKENRKILGTLFSSSLFGGRTPEDHVLLTTFIGGSRQPHLASLETDKLLELVQSEHREILDVAGDPVFADHIYWPRSIPQYSLEYDKVLQAIASLEEHNRGVHLTGNFRGGVSLPDCILKGLGV